MADDERKIVLFYRKGEKDPFWKLRTVDVKRTAIETPGLMTPPRCGEGMRVTVDGKPWGTVKVVARIGASARYLITIRPPRKKKRESPPLPDDAPSVADEDKAPAKNRRKRKPEADEGEKWRNG